MNFILTIDNDVTVHFTRFSFKRAFKDAKEYLQQDKGLPFGATCADFYVTPVSPAEPLADALAKAIFIKHLV